jgi:hypothetical protein
MSDRSDEPKPTRSGYGSPPQHSRYQKGQSGNPSGRPRSTAPAPFSLGEQPTLQAVLKAAERTVSRRENGKVETIPIREAVVQSAILGALKGNSRSQYLAIGILREAEDARALQIRNANALWSNYKEIMTKAIASAIREGRPEPKILPHPDDIVIVPDVEPRFIGPRDEAEEKRLVDILRLRDVLILQDGLEQRLETEGDAGRRQNRRSALVMAQLIDHCVPARFRLSESDWHLRTMKFGHIPKRDLLAQLYTAWRAIGIPKPRGYLTPPADRFIRWFSLVLDLAQEVKAGRLDVDSVARGEWDHITLGILERNGFRG